MENKSHAVVAISFLAVFIICIVAIFSWLRSGPEEARRYIIVSPYSVNGLQKSSPVRYLGIQVGSVKAIEFDRHDPQKVLITIGVYPDAYITRATYAKLTMQGITGVKYLSLAVAPNQALTPLKTSAAHPATIPMHQTLLESLLSGGGGMHGELEKLSDTLDNVNRILSGTNARHLQSTLEQLDAASRHMEAMTQRLAPALQDVPALIQKAQSLMKNSGKAVTDVDHLVRSARRPLDTAGATLKAAKRLTLTADQAVAQIQGQTVPRLNDVLLHLNRTLTQVDALTRELKSKPQSLIYGTQKPPPGPGEPGFQAPGQGGGP